MSLIENIKASEGFDGMPYTDTEGYLTIGYGTKLPIDKKEGQLLAEFRLKAFKHEVNNKLEWLAEKPTEVQDIVYEMAYQMGVPRFMKFKNTIQYIKDGDYKMASIEMLDSLWYRQMHEADMKDGIDSENRAERLSRKMRNIND